MSRDAPRIDPIRQDPATSCTYVRLVGFLLVASALAAGLPADAQSEAFTLGPAGEPRDHFPQIRAYATDTLRSKEGSFDIRVQHGSEEGAAAQAAVAQIQRMARFLTEETGLPLDGRLDLYLFPLEPGSSEVAYHARGPANFTEVLFLPHGLDFLRVRHNRRRLLTLIPHEVIHFLLRGLKLKDRWLEDGLAEYLRHRFANEAVSKGWFPPATNDVAFVHLDNWIPMIVALERTPILPWSYDDTQKLLKQRDRDPAYALYLAQQEWWKYAVARGFVTRWMKAMEEAGSKTPVRDLVRAIKHRRGRVDWDATGELVRHLTGRSREALAKPTEQELAAARKRSWDQRTAEHYTVRLLSLRTLAFLGPPPGVSGEALLPAFKLPAGVVNPEGLIWNLHLAAAGAVAATGDAETARKAALALQDAHGDEAYFYAPPVFWRVLAEKERETALIALARQVGETRAGLESQKQANAILEELTGKTIGWRPEEKAARRETLAALWGSVVVEE